MNAQYIQKIARIHAFIGFVIVSFHLAIIPMTSQEIGNMLGVLMFVMVPLMISIPLLLVCSLVLMVKCGNVPLSLWSALLLGIPYVIVEGLHLRPRDPAQFLSKEALIIISLLYGVYCIKVAYPYLGLGGKNRG